MTTNEQLLALEEAEATIRRIEAQLTIRHREITARWLRAAATKLSLATEVMSQDPRREG